MKKLFYLNVCRLNVEIKKLLNQLRNFCWYECGKKVIRSWWLFSSCPTSTLKTHFSSSALNLLNKTNDPKEGKGSERDRRESDEHNVTCLIHVTQTSDRKKQQPSIIPLKSSWKVTAVELIIHRFLSLCCFHLSSARAPDSGISCYFTYSTIFQHLSWKMFPSFDSFLYFDSSLRSPIREKGRKSLNWWSNLVSFWKDEPLKHGLMNHYATLRNNFL